MRLSFGQPVHILTFHPRIGEPRAKDAIFSGLFIPFFTHAVNFLLHWNRGFDSLCGANSPHVHGCRGKIEAREQSRNAD
jgi:hypothetical protein